MYLRVLSGTLSHGCKAREAYKSITFLRRLSDQGDSNREASEKLKALLSSLAKESSQSKKKPLQGVTMHQRGKQRNVNLEVQLAKAAKDVEVHMKGTGVDEAELLDKILFKSSKSLQPSIKPLNDVLSDMKIEKEVSPPVQKQPRPPRRAWRHATPSMDEIVLFKGDGLGIFSKPIQHDQAIPSDTFWQKCKAHDIHLSITQSPRNIWEEMALWTEQGILWQLPIDNEQGLEEEKNTYFADHVLLEPLLDDWCPSSGPVRHFMQLVCVGLSRNHWLSAKEKRAHILWYRDYFASKSQVLQEIGAGNITLSPNPS